MTYPMFGPAGNSESFYAQGKKSSKQAPAWIKEFGLDCYEYQCGNGVTGSDDNFRAVGQEAEKCGISLSLHAPYFISLSGIDPAVRMKSVNYIRQSVHAAELMGAYLVVVHTGSAAKISREQAMDYARETLGMALDEIDTRVRIGLETMGKINQLGTLDEVIELCSMNPRLYPVVDFGHLNARNLGGCFTTPDDYARVFNKIGEKLGDEKMNGLHCHFSKIEFSAGGEKKHLTFADDQFGPDFEPLAETICRMNLSPRIICESAGTMAEDALAMKKMWQQARDSR